MAGFSRALRPQFSELTQTTTPPRKRRRRCATADFSGGL
jgi:hypothetical protein